MSKEGHNQPPVTLELTPELAQFLLQNMEEGLRFGVVALGLPRLSRDNAEKLVAAIEKNRAIRKLLLDAGVKLDD